MKNPKSNGDRQAFPISLCDPENSGLTKREWLIGMAMQGELASQYEDDNREMLYSDQNADRLAGLCFAYADAILAKLDEEAGE